MCQSELFEPSFLSIKAAFPYGLLSVSGGLLIGATQRRRGSGAAHPSPWVCCMRACMREGWSGGIREASACAAAIVYPAGTRGRLNGPHRQPPSTPQHNGKWGSGKIRETCTHSCHPLDLRESPFYYLKGTRREEGAGLSRQGERGLLLAIAADFWMNKKKEKKRKAERVARWVWLGGEVWKDLP